MGERNPYAPPEANVIEVKDSDCSRDGNMVVVRTGSDLPPRCIVCNAPVGRPIKTKKLYWHSPWLYLLILINIIVYLIVGIIARKSFEVSAGLCEAHESRRKRRVYSLLGAGVVSGAVGAVTWSHEEGAVAAIFFLVALLALVVAAIVGRKVYPRKITKEYARLGGCKEPFLASLE